MMDYGLDEDLTRALRDYIAWIRLAHRDVVIRGIGRNGARSAMFPLITTYVSLTVTGATQSATPPRSTPPAAGFALEPIDFSALVPGGPYGPPGEQRSGDHQIVAESILGVSSTAVITGGPGSGKTTVLKYIALALAESALNPEANMTGKLGLGERVPVPVFIPLNGFATFLDGRPYGANPREFTLLRFAEHYVILRQAYLDLPEDFFARLLQRGVPLVLLLDGLDEIADENQRIMVSRSIEDIAQTPLSCSILVTARPSAYRGGAVLPPSFPEFEIRPLERQQVNSMVSALCDGLYVDPQEQVKNKADLIRAVDTLEEHRETLGLGAGRLITSPLMVRMLLTLHLGEHRVVEQRAQLFAAYIDALLAATYHADAAVAQRLTEVAGPAILQRALLCRIAFELHKRERSENPFLTHDELRGFAVSLLGEGLNTAEAVRAADRFVEATRQRGGLLELEGSSYRFAHLAFQEFLVGRYFADTLRSAAAIAEFSMGNARIASPWWREPILFCIGHLSTTDPETAVDLVRRLGLLIPGPLPQADVELAGLELAGQACIEWQLGQNLDQDVTCRIRERLLDDRVGLTYPRLRAAAGRILGALGDPRPEIISAEAALMWVPAGPFPMGHSAQAARINLPSMQTGSYLVDVGEFAIGRFPVTNAQYACFIEAGGYRSDAAHLWTDAGWSWRQTHRIGEPAYWNNPLWTMLNHPVVGVSWYEAAAYCKWLSSVLDRDISLPTEAEWEKAARGTDRRAWPWGNEPIPVAANTLETEIGQTTCVGLFGSYVGPYGVEDCAGNVWEWCGSQFRDYGEYHARDGREDLAGAAPRVVRGGSWLNGHDHARLANRDHYFPGDRHFDLGFRIKERR
ncbi:SUMF1/EgtB/PvdO family nonheme iron enzyme [Lentzea sp. HUAS12]|uniref:SUMF1/EgtB/PvdO family nonheme iron enzyme n=1 Tax=Lentzea sp. HUAS12 TaxID=2951806 RepID=UPI00209DD187|nr:SUMF1/EgtB/PvdO family nonheme iron enzyme [Lentzea sp. HUAS12]USX56217.1 SUMF1/EgtB/PvdO family nonheme iron enzyme [Lentzea sp. HUAS12]